MTELNPTIVWACIGLGLIILEVFTTTFFLLFFGAAGITVALARVVGLNHLPSEIILFSVVGILGILVFRKKIQSSFQSKATVKINQGQTVKVSEDIASNAEGSIVYRGSPWKAYNNSEYDLKTGDSAIIERIEGIKIILKQS